MKNGDWVGYMIILRYDWVPNTVSRGREMRTWPSSLELTRVIVNKTNAPRILLYRKREPAFFVWMLLIINLLEVILLFLRNFVSICSQKLPKGNEPDNRQAASKFDNFATITNLTLVEESRSVEKWHTWLIWTPQNLPTLRNGVGSPGKMSNFSICTTTWRAEICHLRVHTSKRP